MIHEREEKSARGALRRAAERSGASSSTNGRLELLSVEDISPKFALGLLVSLCW